MENVWWHMTSVATKARHHSAGGADTHACPAPTTGEDEGYQFFLHCLRTSSRHTPILRAWTYLSFVAYELFGLHVFSGFVFISLLPLWVS